MRTSTNRRNRACAHDVLQLGAMASTDFELLEKWRQGDRRSGEVLFERYFPAIERFFRTKLPQQVADLVQETFIACVEGRDRLRDGTNFRAYLFAVANNVLCRYLREKYRSGHDLDFDQVSIEALVTGPVTAVARQREHQLLLDGLRRIPVMYQVVVELRFWEGLRTIEIADILGIPHPTVRRRLQRALKLLREQVNELSASPVDLETTLVNLNEWASRCQTEGDAAADAG